MTTVLVTGAGGEIGHSLLEAFRHRGGYTVVAMDVRPLDGHVAAMADVVLQGDISDETFVRALEQYDIDEVYHLAALLSTSAEKNPELAHKVNVNGTMQLLMAARRIALRRDTVVKFLFPNEHDIYMHDTPSRNLFSRPIRAFSHGCVRIENPLDFARLLLRRDRGWSERYTEEYVMEQLEAGEEKWVSLVQPLPVHIEYFSVRGDDDGRMNFLADIYRYDRARVDEIEAEIMARTTTAVAGDAEAMNDTALPDAAPVQQ